MVRRRLAAVWVGLAAAGIMHCSSEPAAGLRLGLYVQDLVIPEDTNLMGLYVAEIHEGGRIGAVHAFEATPLREGTDIRVPFPASLSVAAGEKTERIHARLVAFQVDAEGRRTALTMREARSAVPSDSTRLLRLSLFWHGIGNVVDDGAGSPVVGATSGVTPQDESGLTSGERFFQLRSVCNGAPAPAEQTAGDDGRCTPLDVDSVPDDLTKPLPDSAEGDPCFAVDQAFASTPTVVDRTTRLELPGETCSVQIPAEAPGSWHAALRTRGVGHPSTDETLRLRPLALGLGARREGDRLVLAAVACSELSKGADVVLVATATPWQGTPAVCSLSSLADAPTTLGAEPRSDASVVDAPPDSPPPDPDAGDAGDGDGGDGSVPATPASLSLVATSVQNPSVQGLAVSGSDLVFTAQLGATNQVQRVLGAFLAGATSMRFVPVPHGPSTEGAWRPYATRVDGITQFYLERADAQAARYVNLNGTTVPVANTGTAHVQVAQLGESTGVLWGSPNGLMGRLVSAVAPSTLEATDIAASTTPFALRDGIGVGNRFLGGLTDTTTTSPTLFDCDWNGTSLVGCSPIPTADGVPGNSSLLELAHGGAGTFFLRQYDSSNAITWIPPRGTPGLPELSLDEVTVSQLVVGPSLVCYVAMESGVYGVRCAPPFGPPTQRFAVFDRFLPSAALSADASYLYVAYSCAQSVELQRIPWDELPVATRVATCAAP